MSNNSYKSPFSLCGFINVACAVKFAKVILTPNVIAAEASLFLMTTNNDPIQTCNLHKYVNKINGRSKSNLLLRLFYTKI